MRRLLPGWIGLFVCLGACAQIPAIVAKRAATRPPMPGSGASSLPSPTPTLAASKAPAPKLLGKPSTAFRTLAGTLQMDARYALDASAGKLLSNNGGGVVGNNGAGVLVVGAGIISDAGALVLTKGNLISDQGSLAVAPGGKDYTLMAASSKVPIGTIDPAAGMALRAVDLATGNSIPLGVAPDGSKVYEVYTNGAGQYEIYLPADFGSNVLLQARVPGTADTRLEYGLLSSKVKANSAIDEDTNKATYYIRLGYTREWLHQLGRLGDVSKARSDAGATAGGGMFGGGTDQAGDPLLPGVLDAAHAAHLERLTDDRARELAGRIADLVLTRLDPTTVKADASFALSPIAGQDVTVFNAYVDVMQKGREAVTRKMRDLEAAGRDPLAYFNNKPYVVAANKGRATPYVIKKPNDVVEFVVDSILANTSQTDPFGPAALDVISDVGMPLDGFEEYMAATQGFFEAQGAVLYDSQPPLINQVLDMIKATGAAPAAPSSSPS